MKFDVCNPVFTDDGSVGEVSRMDLSISRRLRRRTTLSLNRNTVTDKDESLLGRYSGSTPDLVNLFRK